MIKTTCSAIFCHTWFPSITKVFLRPSKISSTKQRKSTHSEKADTFTFVIPDLHRVSRREGYPPLVSEGVGNRNEQSIIHVHAQSRCPSPVIIQNMSACSYFSVCMSLKAKHYILTSTRRRFLTSMPTLPSLNSPDTYLPVYCPA